MSRNEKLKKITVTALFCALAFLMTFVFRFKVSFLTFDFKDAIISIISLLYGPVFGIVSAGLVAIFEFLSVSDTGVYGLIMNFISSGCFALICGAVYKFKRNFGGAIISVVASVIGVTAVMLLANIFITPFYMGVERAEVIALIPILLLPFNLCKSIINAAVLLIIYKPITNTLKKTKLVVGNISSYKLTSKSILLTVISVIILILTALFVVFILKGDFTFLK